MNRTVHERLLTCFRAVMPELTEQEVVSSTDEDFRTWDSVRVVTLIAAIEEEFEVEISEDIDELTSFAEIESFLAENAPNG